MNPEVKEGETLLSVFPKTQVHCILLFEVYFAGTTLPEMQRYEPHN